MIAGKSISSFNPTFDVMNDMEYVKSAGTMKGKMLLIDHAENEKISWHTNIEVVPNTNYLFSIWVTELTEAGNKAILQLAINSSEGIFQPITSPQET